MKKRLAVLLVLTISIGLFACSPSRSVDLVTPSPSALQGSLETVTLSTVGMFGGTDPSAPDYQQLIKEFMDINPHITIKDESATADETWKSRVATDFSSGNDPDVVFYFNGTDAKQLIANKKVVSIEEITRVYPDYIKDISDTAMASMKEYDGKRYAVPVRGFYEGLFCNKDLFDKYDLDLPTDWGKFEAAIVKFKDEGIIPIAISFSDVPHYWIEHLILAQGGIEEHAINPRSAYPESWAKALGYFKTLKEMGAFPIDVNATKNDITSHLFYDKKAAMIIDGSWFIGGLKDPASTVVLPMPSTPDGKKDPKAIIGGFSSGFYISTNAWNDPTKRDAAVKFVMHMTSKKAISLFAKEAGTPAADIPAPSNIPKIMKDGLAMVEQAKGVNMPIDFRLSKEAWTYLVSMIGPIADGEITPEEVLTEVVNKNK